MIVGKDVYKIKSDCVELGNTCCFTQNRVIEKMATCPETCREHLGQYLKCLMIIDSICKCISVCCCNMDGVSGHMVKELKRACNKIMNCIENLEKVCDKDNIEYMKLNKVKKLCVHCSNHTKLLKKSKKNKHNN